MVNLAAQFGFTNSNNIGQAIEEVVANALSRRKPHERRWYDNNFFDDGYHFRSISKKTGRVIDHASGNSQYVERAIPRASRQIRGVSNLLYAAEPYPVVYPKRVSMSDFPPIVDPQTGQKMPNPEYERAMEQAKQVARKQGQWLQTEWTDEQELTIKIIDMILLAAKNSVSWLQVTSDTEKQQILTEVFDAFDVICYGDVRDSEKLPFITKASPMDIEQVKHNPMFDEGMAAKLTPDNKYATSEVKNAYMNTRFGNKDTSDKKLGSIIVKDSFLKEYLSNDNWKQAVKLGSDNGAMEGKSKGDMIMRHAFSAGGVTLKDEYIDYDSYPLKPFRFEPGPLYQVPFIERFIPQNKSLDVIVTRLEKWVNAMVVGVYQVRKGENFEVSNFPGGQKIEFETTPPAQMNMASVGNTPFEVINLLNKFIDEQGATTSGGANVPTGVKSGVAIESVKASEYANLKIATLMLKKTIKEIAECMLERADKDYLKPKEVSSMEDGEPNYFDVVGQRGADLAQKIDMQLPEGTVVLSKDLKVRVEIEPGLGMTMEGKRQSMQAIMDYILNLSKTIPGILPPPALQMMIKKFLEQFGYGSTQELMEALETGMTQGEITDEQILKMKIGIVEAMKESGAIGPEAEKRLVDSTKLGVLEVLKDTGLTDGAGEKGQAEANKPPSRSISFKDLPPDGKEQLAAQAGIRLSAQQIEADEQQQEEQEQEMKQKDMQLKEKTVNSQVKKNSMGGGSAKKA